MRKLLLLTFDDGYFGKKFKGSEKYHIAGKLNINKIIAYIEKAHIEVEHAEYKDLDLSVSYHDYYVAYASTEERGQFYKGYIEDVLLKLKSDGAVLIPEFSLFRAHGNKSFQEMMRKSFRNDLLKDPESDVIGRMKDFDPGKYTRFPYVVKSSAGFGSSGVMLAENAEKMKKAVKKLSRAVYNDYYYTGLRDFFYFPPLWKLKTLYYKARRKPQSMTHPVRRMHDNKVVIQEFIKELDSDYKILFYAGKYYVLNRKNRDHDFRASGSGKFSYPKNSDQISRLLDFAKLCAEELDAPVLSMDIAQSADGNCHLLEFQSLGFGPYTIQYADWHFERRDHRWQRVDGRDDIDKETARAITEYIIRLDSK